LQVHDHPPPVAPLIDGAPEVEGEQPEAAEGGERERDEQDRADADAARAPQIPHRLVEDEAQHYPSSFTRRPPSRRRVRRLRRGTRRAWWVAKSTVVPRLQISFTSPRISPAMSSSRLPV